MAVMKTPLLGGVKEVLPKAIKFFPLEILSSDKTPGSLTTVMQASQVLSGVHAIPMGLGGSCPFLTACAHCAALPWGPAPFLAVPEETDKAGRRFSGPDLPGCLPRPQPPLPKCTVQV
jgi:hypothetical protein